MDTAAIAATVTSASPAGWRAFPLSQRQTRRLTLHTVAGEVSVEVDYGRDRQRGKWVCPARERWGLGPHQKMTPELEDRMCLTATLADSYEAAALLSAKWGSPVDASTIRIRACRMGQRAAAQAQDRLNDAALPESVGAGVKAVAPAASVIMMDGWLARTGSPWRLMLHDLPPWSVVYQQSRRWVRAGCFETMVEDLRLLLRLAAERHDVPSAVILDSRTVQSTPESGGWGGLRRTQETQGFEGAYRRGHIGTSAGPQSDCGQRTRPRAGRNSGAGRTTPHGRSCGVGVCGPKLYWPNARCRRDPTRHQTRSGETHPSQTRIRISG